LPEIFNQEEGKDFDDGLNRAIFKPGNLEILKCCTYARKQIYKKKDFATVVALI